MTHVHVVRVLVEREGGRLAWAYLTAEQADAVGRDGGLLYVARGRKGPRHLEPGGGPTPHGDLATQDGDRW